MRTLPGTHLCAAHQGNHSHYAIHNCEICRLIAERDALKADAVRYQWLRDKSVPPHNFYLSVPVEFADEKYSRKQVDQAIDAAMQGGNIWQPNE